MNDLFQFFIRAGKFSFWILFSFLFLSSETVENGFVNAENKDGVYPMISAMSDVDEALAIPMVFEMNDIASKNGRLYTTLELMMNNADKRENVMGILVSMSSADTTNLLKKYTVRPNAESFLQDFKGVFGFVNVDDLGEKPFFAYNGTFTVNEYNGLSMSGDIHIQFQNFEGQIIQVKRKFTAVKKEVETYENMLAKR
ncbi:MULTISPECIES: hypothetical protein [Zobellia]|uniref:Uncharacterized protein n=1 Tax=Zobellia galactanivorans (strain DSM 12802 / CCUG 47099 / CIP 106680 / NCIMB 13871 / Dsij) TaxID=63186 RepID=G0LBC1_ZOBGA|nr:MULTISPECIES: hypothetical protein [Zobellia]OWW26945.1 hypothetical protein B4Q04_04520 [Zobellia sp. OII3]CAZ95949.1 Conserved hypothetical protein [Zobellia galactanivorans]